MTNNPSPLRFTTLRRFHVLTGAGAVVAVFFQPAKSAGDQEADSHAKQQHGQRKPKGLRSV